MAYDEGMTWTGDIVRAEAGAAEAEIARVSGERDGLQARVLTLDAEVALRNEDIADRDAEIAALKARIVELTPLKPALRGLVTTDPGYLGNIPYAEFCSTKPRWKDVETPIDNMLAAHPGIGFRLRFMAGVHSPDWVKASSGGAIQHNPSTPNGGSGLVPRFWTENYFTDYMEFIAAVADRYEGNPQVVEITNALTTTVYAEPFILNADPATVTRYWNAVYRWADVHDSLMESMHGMMELFPTTRISLAGHGKWERIIDGKMNYDWPAERDVFNDLIDAYGPRLVLDDHGLGADDAIGTPQPADTATSWYNYMNGLEDTDQSYGWQFTLNGGPMSTAADMGVAMGACFLEFAAFEGLTSTKRRQIHDALLANAADKP
jgi:hypothetical protein